MNETVQFTAFVAEKQLGQGNLEQLLPVVKQCFDHGERRPIWIFNDNDGRTLEVDLSHSLEVLLRHWPERFMAKSQEVTKLSVKRGPGRPKLGVVAREVTLLPRHWEWLNAQPGGASVALRKLVEQARRELAPADRRRQSQERTYRILSTLAGDAPAYEEALRALYAGDAASFEQITAIWPTAIGAYARRMAAESFIDEPKTTD